MGEYSTGTRTASGPSKRISWTTYGETPPSGFSTDLINYDWMNRRGPVIDPRDIKAQYDMTEPLPALEFPEFSFPDYAAEYEAMLAEQERIIDENRRDELYGTYLDAASSAADYVNAEIAEEQANADLLGINYEMTDEIKGQRISNYFATLWGESDQTELEALIEKRGAPAGFTEFTIKRGDPSQYQTEEDPSVTPVSVSKGIKLPGRSATEDVLGISDATLGG